MTQQAAVLCHLAKFLPSPSWSTPDAVHFMAGSSSRDYPLSASNNSWIWPAGWALTMRSEIRASSSASPMALATPESAKGSCFSIRQPCARPPSLLSGYAMSRRFPRLPLRRRAAPQKPASAPTREARDEAAAPAPYPWPDDIATLLRDPPRYGQGLLPWIKLMAIRMLSTGADPQIIAARSTWPRGIRNFLLPSSAPSRAPRDQPQENYEYSKATHPIAECVRGT